jgi:Na+/H+-dicarboxylate symporter
METCESKLGANQRLVSFIYPLASVIYMPETIVYLAVTVCTFAEIYQIGIDLAWVAMAVIGAALIAIALPPIPNSTILGFTILFSMLGIPSQGLMMVTAIDVLVDFFDTGFNVMLMIFHTACEANRLGSLNRSILLNKHQSP